MPESLAKPGSEPAGEPDAGACAAPIPDGVPLETLERMFWDEAYAEGAHEEHWEALDPRAEATEEAARLAAAGVAPPTRVLDLGCGGGLEAAALTTLGFRVVGVDLSPGALRVARARGVGLPLLAGSAFALPFRAGSFPVVHDRGCLHAIDPDERNRYAAEVRRVLAPGGLLVVRGARSGEGDDGFFAVDEGALQAHFRRGFTWEAPEPIDLPARSGALPAHRVVLRAR